MQRRPVSPFSLSFLDIMFCGFGAVVLLVLILNADTVRSRNAVFADMRADVVKREREVLVGRANLVEIRNSLEATEQELVVTEGESERVLQRIRELESEIARQDTLEAEIAELPVVDTQRVQDVQRTLATGSFEIQPARVADKMLSFEAGLGKAE